MKILITCIISHTSFPLVTTTGSSGMLVWPQLHRSSMQQHGTPIIAWFGLNAYIGTKCSGRPYMQGSYYCPGSSFVTLQYLFNKPQILSRHRNLIWFLIAGSWRLFSFFFLFQYFSVCGPCLSYIRIPSVRYTGPCACPCAFFHWIHHSNCLHVQKNQAWVDIWYTTLWIAWILLFCRPSLLLPPV